MKRIISMLLVLVTIVASLAACNGNKPNETDPSSDPSHVHAFGEWVTVKIPNCTDKGEKVRTCECGEKETEELPVSGEHVYDYTVTSPTTEKGGYTTYTCVGCGTTYTGDETDKLPSRVDGMMVYFEDFDGLKAGATSGELFKALGWKNLYKNGRTAPTDIDIEDCKIGSATISTITLGAENGQLIVNNAKNGKESFMQILSAEYMAPAATGDYSVQLDMTFKSGNGWVSIAPRYFSSTGANSCYASWRLTSSGGGLHEGQGTGGLLRAAMNVNTVKYSNYTVESGWWCSRTVGYKDITTSTDPNALIDRKLTVLFLCLSEHRAYLFYKEHA